MAFVVYKIMMFLSYIQIMKLILTVILSIFFISTALSQRYFELKGHWQVEGKETYEVWRIEGEKLTGEGYKLIDGKKHITERLVITQVGDDVFYMATVPNQNAGATISFKLNNSYKDRLVFENPDHDFPNKISYEQVDPDRFYVQVSGQDSTGFSFYLVRIQ